MKKRYNYNKESLPRPILDGRDDFINLYYQAWELAFKNIEYINMSMTDIAKLDDSFDFIYSSLAFHYIKDFDAFAKEMYSVLNVGGQLLFSQEHPIITATIDGNGHFNKNLKGKRVSYTFSNYNEPGERKVHWYVDGVIKYHRTFSNIINALTKAGFVIEQMIEQNDPAVMEAEGTDDKSRKAKMVPISVCFKARKL